MLGGGDYTFKTVIGVLLYVCATIFMPIAMLNMVISVVSETYDRVRSIKQVQDMILRAGMLQEYQQFLFLFK